METNEKEEIKKIVELLPRFRRGGKLFAPFTKSRYNQIRSRLEQLINKTDTNDEFAQRIRKEMVVHEQ